MPDNREKLIHKPITKMQCIVVSAMYKNASALHNLFFFKLVDQKINKLRNCFNSFLSPVF